MIVRTWHGCVPEAFGDGFEAHLQKTGVKHAQGVIGNCGALVKRMPFQGYEHFFLATYCNSIEAIKNFAGEDYQLAVHYPEDDWFQLIADPYVFHHSVAKIQELE